MNTQMALTQKQYIDSLGNHARVWSNRGFECDPIMKGSFDEGGSSGI